MSPLETLRIRVMRSLSMEQSNNSAVSIRSAIISVAILGLWLGVVIFAATRHEFWRDEVRALSLVRAAGSPLDLYGLLQNEGHPIVWYLLLYFSKSIVDASIILPVTSIIIAFAAVTVFMFFSPFQLWIRCLFIFGALPVYEYSVMARNYGLSMLLLFAGAALYQNRTKHPLLLAFVLAVLANTNVHSAILACLIAALWGWDTVVEQRTTSVQSRGSSLYLPLAVVFTGVLLSVAFAWPRANTIVTSVAHIRAADLAYSFSNAVLQPGQAFYALLPNGVPPFAVSVALYIAAFGLLARPNLFLAAMGAQIGLGVFFRVAYPGSYRHQGLLLVFLVFLYWIFIRSLEGDKGLTKTKSLLFYAGLYVALPVLVLGNVVKAKDAAWADISVEMSSSKAFGSFLNTAEDYRDAIILPEPDYLLESLPYYASNRIYLPREHRFGTTVSFTTEADPRLSLGELLSLAGDLKTRSGKPVLIVLGHWDIDKCDHCEKRYSYNKVFTWTGNDLEEFNRLTTLVAEFGSAYTDENYRVYALR